jgi:hypothetical protein
MVQFSYLCVFFGTGIIEREGSSFRGASCKVYEGVDDHVIIEALVLPDAVLSATSRGFRQVTFQVDWNSSSNPMSMLVHNTLNFLRCIEIIDYLPNFVCPYIVECKFHMTKCRCGIDVK